MIAFLRRPFAALARTIDAGIRWLWPMQDMQATAWVDEIVEDRALTDLGIYAHDPRIAGVIGGNLVVLRNGHTIQRISPKHVWRLHSGDGITYQDRYWYAIYAALSDVLGPPESPDYAEHVAEACALTKETSC